MTERRIQLNTTGFTLFGLDWANKRATCLVCQLLRLHPLVHSPALMDDRARRPDALPAGATDLEQMETPPLADHLEEGLPADRVAELVEPR